jgi:hypothetical protein
MNFNVHSLQVFMVTLFYILFYGIFILLNVNLILAVVAKRIFLIGFYYKTNKDMTVFELKMEYGKPYSIGNWFQKGESGYTTAVVANSVLYCVFLFILF